MRQERGEIYKALLSKQNQGYTKFKFAKDEPSQRQDQEWSASQYNPVAVDTTEWLGSGSRFGLESQFLSPGD